MVFSESVKELITDEIYKYCKKKRFNNIFDGVMSFLDEDIVQEKFTFMNHSNFGDFISESLKNKLFIAASDLNLIEKKHRIKTSHLFDDVE